MKENSESPNNESSKVKTPEISNRNSEDQERVSEDKQFEGSAPVATPRNSEQPERRRSSAAPDRRASDQVQPETIARRRSSEDQVRPENIARHRSSAGQVRSASGVNPPPNSPITKTSSLRISQVSPEVDGKKRSSMNEQTLRNRTNSNQRNSSSIDLIIKSSNDNLNEQRKSSVKTRPSQESINIINRKSQTVQKDSVQNILTVNEEITEPINKLSIDLVKLQDSPESCQTKINLKDNSNIRSLQNSTSMSTNKIKPQSDKTKRNSIWAVKDDNPDGATFEGETEGSEVNEDEDIDPTSLWVLPPPGARLADRSVTPNFFISKKNEILEARERQRELQVRERAARRAVIRSQRQQRLHQQQVQTRRRKQEAAWRRKCAEQQKQMATRFQQIERRKRLQMRRISRRHFEEAQERIARERQERRDERRRRVEEEGLYQWLQSM